MIPCTCVPRPPRLARTPHAHTATRAARPRPTGRRQHTHKTLERECFLPTTQHLNPTQHTDSHHRAPERAPQEPPLRRRPPGAGNIPRAAAPPRASAVARARAAVLGGRARRPPAEHTPMAMHTFTPLDRRVRHRHAIILAPLNSIANQDHWISAPLSLKSGYEDRV